MNQASNLGPATSVYFASDPRPFLDRAARPMILLAADFQMRLPWVKTPFGSHGKSHTQLQATEPL
jgi:hypothetical protein